MNDLGLTWEGVEKNPFASSELDSVSQRGNNFYSTVKLSQARFRIGCGMTPGGFIGVLRAIGQHVCLSLLYIKAYTEVVIIFSINIIIIRSKLPPKKFSSQGAITWNIAKTNRLYFLYF